MGKIISYFDPASKLSKPSAYYFALLLISSMLLRTIYVQTWVFGLRVLGLKIKIAISSLLYRKLLRLSPSALSKVSGGKIITLTTKDMNSIHVAIDMMIVMIVGLAQVGIMIVVTYREMGVSALIGTGFMITMFPIQGKSEIIRCRYQSMKSVSGTIDMRKSVWFEVTVHYLLGTSAINNYESLQRCSNQIYYFHNTRTLR